MLYAISDLHLSLSSAKPMDVFGRQWEGHTKKIRANWLDMLTESDTVLIAGDISWGMRREGAKADLDFLQKLPGVKVLSCGNHDYWWNSTSKLNEAYPGMFFLKNTHFGYNDYAICATRGWLCPEDANFNPQTDMKIYKRERLRLTASLDSAVRAGYGRIILALHYPPAPLLYQAEPNYERCDGFLDIICNYPIEIIVFGHLHGIKPYSVRMPIKYGNTRIFLVSSDFLDFKPIRLL